MNDTEKVASELILGLGLLRRRLRQLPLEGEVSLPEYVALHRLERDGATTASALAKAEQISPQSMGETLAKLEQRGLIQRSKDPGDGRRILLALTAAGAREVGRKRATRIHQIAEALATLSPEEQRHLAQAAPILERLAERL